MEHDAALSSLLGGDIGEYERKDDGVFESSFLEIMTIFHIHLLSEWMDEGESL